jgi:hypothetical protein
MPILYHELNKDDTILVQGWVQNEEPEPTWHVWCETCAGERVDPNVILFEMDETYYKLNYFTEGSVPGGSVPGLVTGHQNQDEETTKQWELYEKDPQEFWKTQPPEIKAFRSKLFSLVKKKKF